MDGPPTPAVPPAGAPIPIMGCHIQFPNGKRPFPAQLALMSNMIKALCKRQNALLESPTGEAQRMGRPRPRAC